MSALKRRAWLFLAATLTLQLVLTRSARVLRHDLTSHEGSSGIYKRSDDPSAHSSLFPFPYAVWYEEASPTTKPWIIVGMLLGLGFLFSFIGITASDFFCPNLSSIAAILGLNESTAGVTFLAFGNGSPDVFSTFAALKSGTFGLAVGELIGAASFIVSVVVGTIVFVRPFHVPKQAFMRDVLFFTAAVILLVAVLRDGILTLSESLAMVGLYVCYVIVVVAGNWLNRRRKSSEGKIHARPSPAIMRTPSGQRTALPKLQIPEPTPRAPSPTAGNSAHSEASSANASPVSANSPSRPRMKPVRYASSSRIHNLGAMSDEGSINTPRANFSLLGAVEFRDVVNSLRSQDLGSRGHSPARSPNSHHHLEPNQDYFSARPGDLAHRRAVSIGVSLHTKSSKYGRKRAVSHLDQLPDETSITAVLTPTPLELPEPNPWTDQPGLPRSTSTPTWSIHHQPDVFHNPSASASHNRTPSIAVVDPSGAEGPADSPPLEPTSHHRNESRFRIRRRTRMVLRILFPSLQSFRHKSYLGMFLAVVCVPQLLALTLTLPVVDDGGAETGGIALPTSEAEPLNDPGVSPNNEEESDDTGGGDNRLLRPEVGEELHHLVDHRFSPLHSPLGRISHAAMRRQHEDEEAMHDEDGADEDDSQKEIWEEVEEDEALDFNKYLTAIQCVLGPAWCTLTIFRGASYFWWILLGVSIAGTLSAGAVLMYAVDGSSPAWRMVRCLAGFVCSMVWIAAIADEVVGILKAVGVILGLSDAIVGLTIFAVGNSLADLVANVTVAQFAPAMAYAACFGGPMLNLLLGVGGSGTYHLLTHPKETVSIHFSPTLWVSATGLVIVLVGTAIIVPLNGYLIDRKWATCLLICYAVLMVTNVLVEIKTGR
ncbi:Sodium/calcium exchanger protein-domain-containing protein [Kockovaella imperatae]|uniref:Sodium/calcium exchanger protein-domain-containing protein n=1 Tax=Kockovaella imperatae TaxID=4999 RepID=A0A1Y1USZ5_9TREE|nr:Sodium/calcium exchanger protein-domain-containing protein [Kockovaella imperatae]ORX41138.1 Sodium/calcium exchanger protein-domain-containing protein [Kockovaella imperatae]